MPVEWSSTDQAGGHGVKMLVYGGAGSGKTVLATTMPTPIIISAEAGLLSIQNHKIPVAKIKSLADLSEVYNWCRGSAGAKQFQSICLDSVSEIAETVLATELRLTKDPRKAYGELATKTVSIVRDFRDLVGFHTYFSAKMEYVKDEAGNMIHLPMMPGQKLGQGLPYFFDEVFFLGIGEWEGKKYRFLQTDASASHVAKDRSGKLAAIEKPHLGEVIAKILK